MDGVTSGILVGSALLFLNLVVAAIQTVRKDTKKEKQKTSDNSERICELEKSQKETHELVKLSLHMSVILGDGMVQSGVNGAVKTAFETKKQEIIERL